MGLESPWNAIEPSAELKYHKCYGSFECARLEVPLDWSNVSNPNRVVIAIAKLPAVVDIADESYGGTIVINPGGPSGSGVRSVLTGGKSLQTVVDSDKHFDILSFDPRGVLFTTPSLNCFGNGGDRTSLDLMLAGAGSLESNENALNFDWSTARGVGLLCAQTDNGKFPDSSKIQQYVSTAMVAHDMVAIIDQVDDHQREELRSRGRLFQQEQAILPPESEKGPPLLNYWGLSYGSYLGNTFASMFPDRIGRMILDGVVDADDYAVTGWTTNLQDHNKTWETFFQYCYEAGDKCELFKPSLRSPSEVQDQVEAFLADLQRDPSASVEGGNVYIGTYLATKTIIHVYLYQPIQLWRILAYVLRAFMEQKMGEAFSAMNTAATELNPSHGHFAPMPPYMPHIPMLQDVFMNQMLPLANDYPGQQEAAVSILCGDGDDITSRTKAEFTEYMALLESQSPLAGSLWAGITLACNHWQRLSRPSDENRFTGPFRSNLSDYDPRASPLLFIGNTADPVTPLRNAFKMSEGHEGSVVLTQDMPGHCAGSSNPSVCTFGVVKEFFANGTLPEKGLVCEALIKPWGI